jgi:Putative transposase/Transposase zinc-binding domain
VALAEHPHELRYERHRPETTVLYKTIEKHWPSFRERIEQAGPLPSFVATEFEAFLACGRLEEGFVRVACSGCGFERLVAFSCKRRGFCPSCLGRRMHDVAAHLTESVLPEVPLRQWVCSLPWSLRVLCGYDRELCADVFGAFSAELMRSLRFRAKREFDLASVEGAEPGAISFLQRFDSALRLNVHSHVLALDGVYVQRGDDLTFHALSDPTEDDVLALAERTAERVTRILKSHGRSLDSCDDNAEADRDPALASCYGLAARVPKMRVVETDGARTDEHVAVVHGFNIHAGKVIDGRDRQRVERVVRYLARPSLAQTRLEELPDGRLRYEMKRVWRDGTRFVVFAPHDLLARLCAMVPPPWFHMLRAYGVLAPNAALRSQVVPRAHAVPSVEVNAELGAEQRALFGSDDNVESKSSRKPWAWLLAHTFSIDVLQCPSCGGRLRWLAVATSPEAIAKGLADAGLRARGPPRPRPAPPEQLMLGLSL